MKRTLWIVTLVLALAATATLPLMAQPPQGRSGMGRGMGMGPGPGGPGGPGFGAPMGFLRGVQLTDAQREQIRAIMENERQNAPAGKVAELNKQLQLAILADTPDTAKIDELKSTLAATAAEELAHRVSVETRIVQILTPEQKTQARENISKSGPPQGRGR